VATGGLLLCGLSLILGSTDQAVYAWPVTPMPSPTPPHTRPVGPAFVKPGGTGGWCLQSDPCDSIQYAIEQCEPGNGDTIYVAGGIYTGTGGAVITITKNVTIYGGWDGSPTGSVVRSPQAYPTTLDAEGQRRGVYISGTVTVTLEGFTVTNGVASDKGAGLYSHNARLVLRHMTFYSNVIDVHGVADYAYGGGATVEGGTLAVFDSTFRRNSVWATSSCAGGGMAVLDILTTTVEDSLFQENDAWHGSGLDFDGPPGDAPLTVRRSRFVDNGWGMSPGSAYGGYRGAMEVSDAIARLEANDFIHNRGNNDTGALGVYYSELLLASNLFSGHQSGRTSAVYLWHTPFTLTNNIIVENESIYSWPQNPAIRVYRSDGVLVHNTLARNDSTYGVLVDEGSTVVLTNTILVSHTVGITVVTGSTATLEATLWGAGIWANGTDWGGDGAIITGTINVWDDPAFVDPDGGDYHIGSGSAAVNAGVDAGVTTDIDDDPRPAGADYDIGADEFWYRIHLPLVTRDY
jgi:hypothetical protein